MRSRAGKVRLKTPPEELRAAGVLLPDWAEGQVLDLPAIFGNRRPVEIEIGSGKGAFLMRRAAQRPEINFLGVEWLPVYAQYAADRAFRAGLKNVRLLCAEAEQIFASALPDESVWRVHVYFPDPWPKTRHQRRRLIKPAFLRHVRRVLRLGGGLSLVTDHEHYYRQMQAALRATEGLTPTAFTAAGEDILVGSNYEHKFAQTGKGFHTLAALRYK